ncbi:MAG: hypothetical protein ACJA0Y_001592, partial [Maricaulis maris]
TPPEPVCSHSQLYATHHEPRLVKTGRGFALELFGAEDQPFDRRDSTRPS